MAFTTKVAVAINREKENDELLPYTENIHLFDNFMNQFNTACKLLNNTSEDCIRLKYYLVYEILVFEVLKDCHIPIINHELSTHEKFYFDNDLSFESFEGDKFYWYMTNNDIFKHLVRTKQLKYYKTKDTTLEDLIEKTFL